ncbi:MAG: hypothetical protein LQ337_006362 [Flavoplaca oasis]|nr:MAG: hypothetical protein LQ337_006362 [Flavoplaca oasis]
MTTALLIVDMQKVFSSMTTTCLPKILRLATHFKTHSLPIIFTQHGHSKAELTPPLRNQLVRKWGPSGSIATGSHDWELMHSIADFISSSSSTKHDGNKTGETSSYPIIPKNTYDAFLNTNLASVLEENKVERVVVCGVMTDCCCDTTARSAFNRGYETWLVGDACGTASKRQHEAGLNGFGYAFGEVLQTEEVVKRLQ